MVEDCWPWRNHKPESRVAIFMAWHLSLGHIVDCEAVVDGRIPKTEGSYVSRGAKRGKLVDELQTTRREAQAHLGLAA